MPKSKDIKDIKDLKDSNADVLYVLWVPYVLWVLPKDGEGPDLRLVLRRQRTFQGRVVSTTGGVPGAVVTAWAPFGGKATASVGQSVTGPDGRFEVALPPDTVLLNLLVMPPGHALRMATILAPQGQSVEIPVDRQGGTLVLEMAAEGPSPLLVQGGTFTLPELLKPWARLQGVPASDPARLMGIPSESGQGFRREGGHPSDVKAATDSEARRPPIPT